MTTAELERNFQVNHVPESYYSFHGMAAGDCYVIENQSGRWSTYYSERGSRYEQKQYDTEDDACRAMFSLVAKMVSSSQHRTISLLS